MEEGNKRIDERLERIREERRVGEIVRIRMKVLENQFIDEFPELSRRENNNVRDNSKCRVQVVNYIIIYEECIYFLYILMIFVN